MNQKLLHSVNIRWGFITFIAALSLGMLSARQGVDFDQSINYQVALRQLHGQVIYKDFYVAHGPLAGFFLLPFFWITPTVGWAILLSSACLNAFASLGIFYCVFSVTKRLLLAISASLLTAFWFLPPFGSVYHDHIAFLFVQKKELR